MLIGVADHLLRRIDRLEDVLADQAVADRLFGQLRVLADRLLELIGERSDFTAGLLRLPHGIRVAADHGLHAAGGRQCVRVKMICWYASGKLLEPDPAR